MSGETATELNAALRPVIAARLDVFVVAAAECLTSSPSGRRRREIDELQSKSGARPSSRWLARWRVGTVVGGDVLHAVRRSSDTRATRAVNWIPYIPASLRRFYAVFYSAMHTQCIMFNFETPEEQIARRTKKFFYKNTAHWISPYVNVLIMVTLCNRADHYIFAL